MKSPSSKQGSWGAFPFGRDPACITDLDSFHCPDRRELDFADDQVLSSLRQLPLAVNFRRATLAEWLRYCKCAYYSTAVSQRRLDVMPLV